MAKHTILDGGKSLCFTGGRLREKTARSINCASKFSQWLLPMGATTPERRSAYKGFFDHDPVAHRQFQYRNRLGRFRILRLWRAHFCINQRFVGRLEIIPGQTGEPAQDQMCPRCLCCAAALVQGPPDIDCRRFMDGEKQRGKRQGCARSSASSSLVQ